MSEIQMVITTIPRKSGWAWRLFVDGELIQQNKRLAPSDNEAQNRAKDALIIELQRRLGSKPRKNSPARPKITVRLECGHIRRVRLFAGNREQRVECLVCGDLQAVVAHLPNLAS